MKHCDDIQLEAFLKYELSCAEEFRCRVHLLFCKKCRTALAEMRATRAFLSEFREGVLAMEKAHLEADATEKKSVRKKEYEGDCGC